MTRTHGSGSRSMLLGLTFWALAMPAAGVGVMWMTGCQKDEATTVIVDMDAGPPPLPRRHRLGRRRDRGG